MLVFISLLILSSCSEENAILEADVNRSVVYESKHYTPPSQEFITPYVKSFVEKLFPSSSTLREPFEDTEVNQGRWLMEASGNYLYNQNLKDLDRTREINLEIEIDNTVSGGVLKMKGTKMTEKYSDMISLVESQLEPNEKICALDLSVISANSQSTRINVAAIIRITLLSEYDCGMMGNNGNSSAFQMSTLAKRVQECLSNVIADNFTDYEAMGCHWYSQTFRMSMAGGSNSTEEGVIEIILGEQGRRCSSNGERLIEVAAPTIVTPISGIFDTQSDQTRIAYDIVQDIKNEFLDPSNSGYQYEGACQVLSADLNFGIDRDPDFCSPNQNIEYNTLAIDEVMLVHGLVECY